MLRRTLAIGILIGLASCKSPSLRDERSPAHAAESPDAAHDAGVEVLRELRFPEPPSTTLVTWDETRLRLIDTATWHLIREVKVTCPFPTGDAQSGVIEGVVPLSERSVAWECTENGVEYVATRDIDAPAETRTMLPSPPDVRNQLLLWEGADAILASVRALLPDLNDTGPHVLEFRRLSRGFDGAPVSQLRLPQNAYLEPRGRGTHHRLLSLLAFPRVVESRAACQARPTRLVRVDALEGTNPAIVAEADCNRSAFALQDDKAFVLPGPGLPPRVIDLSGKAKARVFDNAREPRATKKADYDSSDFPRATIAVDPGGRFVATAGDKQPVRLYDAATGHEIALEQPEGAEHADVPGPLVFTRENTLVASSGTGRLAVWSVPTLARRLALDLEDRPGGITVPEPSTRATLSPDMHWLVVSGSASGDKVVDVRTGEIRVSPRAYPGSDPDDARALSPDGAWLAAYGRAGLTILDTHSRAARVISSVPAPGRDDARTRVYPLEWSPDSTWLLVGRTVRRAPTFEAVSIRP